MQHIFCSISVAFGLLAAAGGSVAQTPKPERKPSLSPAAAGATQSSQLPAGVDTGEPGGGQPSTLEGTVPRDQTRKNLLKSRDTAASGPNAGVDDSAAAKLAARQAPRPAAAASATPVRK